MATSILSHVVICPTCAEQRTITDNTTYYTVEACSCGDTEAFDLIDIDVATAKPPWKTGIGGLP
jgi:hypothetical protein